MAASPGSPASSSQSLHPRSALSIRPAPGLQFASLGFPSTVDFHRQFRKAAGLDRGEKAGPRVLSWRSPSSRGEQSRVPSVQPWECHLPLCVLPPSCLYLNCRGRHGVSPAKPWRKLGSRESPKLLLPVYSTPQRPVNPWPGEPSSKTSAPESKWWECLEAARAELFPLVSMQCLA